MNRFERLAWVVLGLTVACTAAAADFPVKPVRIIVASGPGSGDDFTTRVLAVTSAARSPMLPEVPSMAEAGLPGYEMPAWRSIMGPAGMPADVVAILNNAIPQALASPELRERYANAGSLPAGSTPEELRKRYEQWTGIFGKIAKDAGVKPQ